MVNPEVESKLREAQEYCDENDKSTEFMIQYMQDFAEVDFDEVMSYLHANRDQSAEVTIRDLQLEIVEWADSIMPERTAQNAFRKLMEEEIEEMKADPEDPMEFADAIIVLFDLAWLMNIDIAKAVKEKMAINKARKWKKVNGLLKHIKEGEEDADTRCL